MRSSWWRVTQPAKASTRKCRAWGMAGGYMDQTRPSPTLSRGFTRLGRFLAPYGFSLSRVHANGLSRTSDTPCQRKPLHRRSCLDTMWTSPSVEPWEANSVRPSKLDPHDASPALFVKGPLSVSVRVDPGWCQPNVRSENRAPRVIPRASMAHTPPARNREPACSRPPDPIEG